MAAVAPGVFCLHLPGTHGRGTVGRAADPVPPLNHVWPPSSRCRADHFQASDAPPLAAYCRAVVLEKIASSELTAAGLAERQAATRSRSLFQTRTMIRREDGSNCVPPSQSANQSLLYLRARVHRRSRDVLSACEPMTRTQLSEASLTSGLCVIFRRCRRALSVAFVQDQLQSAQLGL
jgi:hypothetical protein